MHLSECYIQKLSTLTPRKGCVLTLNLGRVYDLVSQPKVDRVTWHTSQAGPYRKPLVPVYLYSECNHMQMPFLEAIH